MLQVLIFYQLSLIPDIIKTHIKKPSNFFFLLFRIDTLFKESIVKKVNSYTYIIKTKKKYHKNVPTSLINSQTTTACLLTVIYKINAR